jgi:Zn-dependent protease
MPRDFDLHQLLVGIVAIMVAITVHEFAHAYSADRAGDKTPRINGRISLNPLDHFDPIGGLMILFTLIAGFGIGWGKPVPVNSLNFRHPRWDDIKVSFWGPLSNLLLALALGTIVRFGLVTMGTVWSELAVTTVKLNIALALFNLIPIPPLDGSHILANMLPHHQAVSYAQFMGRFGLIALILLLVSGIGGAIIMVPAFRLFALFTGGYW